ncbi:MAG: NAD(P)-dependent oxidoreductase [Pseudomonadota bacterium]|nr:NAD(P)-dependent oxidoreductase [Pseudomonadota bacterium]
MSGSLVAVTGATGFIGSVLLRSLSNGGWKVRALTRSPRADDEFTQWVEGDLDNLSSLRSLVKGVTAVVHCAGQVRGSSLGDFVHTNVEGTGNLVRASIQQNSPPRFLLISSLAARQPELSWYAASKRMAEKLVTDQSHIMPCAVFRPTAVYGPGDKEMSPLFRATRRGILPMVGQPAMRFGLLHVSDLVAAILCWLSAKIPVNGVYELDDGTPGGYDTQSVAAIAQDVWKRPVYSIFLPAPLISLIANINLWVARLLRYSPMLTPGKVRELQHPNWVCDIAPLTQALPNWRPCIRLRDALLHAI